MKHNILAYGSVPPHLREDAKGFIDALPANSKQYGPPYMKYLMGSDRSEAQIKYLLDTWKLFLMMPERRDFVLTVIQSALEYQSDDE